MLEIHGHKMYKKVHSLDYKWNSMHDWETGDTKEIRVVGSKLLEVSSLAVFEMLQLYKQPR